MSCIRLIQVTKWFIKEQPMEWLEQTSNEGKPLPLAKGQSRDWAIEQVIDGQLFAHIHHGGPFVKCAWYKLEIFSCGKIHKQPQILKEER